jgi:hypothetical protein
MTQEKIHEVREWATFILSFMTVVAIPVGLLILGNQRLSIERDIAAHYVSKESYIEDRSRAELGMHEEAKHIGEIQGKLDSLLLEQVHMNDTVSILKDELTHKK